MTRQTLNVGMVGYQFMGRAHADAYARIPMHFQPSMQLVRRAICGRDHEAVHEAAGRLGFESVETDWRALVKRPDIDVIDISAPSNAHMEIALAAAAHGKHIFCEKPLALTLQDSRAMLKAVRQAGVKHQIGFNYRFAPALVLARRMIEEGKLGRVYHVRGHFLQDWIIDPEYPRVWRLNKAVCGSGSLGDLGAHVLDAARYLAGEIKTVAAMSRTFVAERPSASRMSGLSGKADRAAPREKVDVDDATLLICAFENGAMGQFEATRFAQGHKNDMSIEVNGERGSVRFSFERMNELEFFSAGDESGLQGWRLIQVSEGLHPYWENWWPTGHVIGYSETFCHELFEFAECIAHDRPCAPDFADGVRCAMIMAAAERSACTSTFVNVDDM